TGPERRESRVGRGIGHRVADRATEVKDSVTAAASNVAGRASDLAVRAQDRAQELGHRAREQSRRAQGGFSRMLEENPLAVVAGATILGLAVGLLAPETERENRLMGSARDDLMDQAQTTAREASEVVREEVGQRGPEIEAALKDAAETVGTEVKEAAARVRDEAKRAAKNSAKERGTDAV
ncbi:MAG: hypothetical protein ACRDJK_09445, partial [Actinomycetota bacterium]